LPDTFRPPGSPAAHAYDFGEWLRSMALPCPVTLEVQGTGSPLIWVAQLDDGRFLSYRANGGVYVDAA